jgi:hypothetical protein
MRKIIGGLFILAAFLVAIFGGLYLLIIGAWDIFSNFDTMTFGQFIRDVIFILLRDILSWVIAFILGFIGLLFIKD